MEVLTGRLSPRARWPASMPAATTGTRASLVRSPSGCSVSLLAVANGRSGVIGNVYRQNLRLETNLVLKVIQVPTQIV